jgi:hypothetical protein
MITEMAMPEVFKINETTRVSMDITREDFVDGYKKGRKESTATSPSGRYISHFKAIIRDTEMRERNNN